MGRLVEVRGELWSKVTDVLRFEGPEDAWTRVFYVTRKGETYRTYPAVEVRVIQNAATAPRPSQVLTYWRDLVEQLPNLNGGPHPLKRAYKGMDAIHPESALAHYLAGEAIGEEQDERLPIFPFSSNLSQHEALLKALKYPLSVIDGPPGTGKTQTILNLLATLSATSGVTVGVVSANNAAVDNVRDKLTDLGFGYIVASLGRRDKKEAFFAGQGQRNAAVAELLATEKSAAAAERSGITSTADEGAGASKVEQLRDVEKRILKLQHDERTLAQVRQDLDAHRLEFRHFTRYLEGHEIADLDGIALLRRSSDRILDYLAETQLIQTRVGTDRPIWGLRWLRRLRWLLKYGPLRGIDAGAL